MNDLARLRSLRDFYLKEITKYGDKIKKWNSPQFKAIRGPIIALNRQHKVATVKMYAKIVSKISKQIGKGR